MLMMLMMPRWFGSWEEVSAADTHDAGVVWDLEKQPVQLMLMMFVRLIMVGLFALGTYPMQLMLKMLMMFMMQEWFGDRGRSHCG